MGNETNETKKNWEAAVLLLLIERIYEVHRRDGLRWHDIHKTFHEDWFGNSGNINVITSTV
jgi:hypothetical protein